jgi:hypothetical protein
MSDMSQGPGWWQASDGKWYPPEQHPGYRTRQAEAPAGPYQGPHVMNPQEAPEERLEAHARHALEDKGFIRSLYDFSFSSLVTMRVIRVLYALITIIYSLAAVITFAVLLVRHTPVDIVLAIIVVPLAYLIYLTIARITLEVLMVIFNIGKDVRTLRERGETEPGPGASAKASPSW